MSLTPKDLDLASQALADAAPAGSFGDFIGKSQEGAETQYRFGCMLASYRDWHWTVLLSQPDKRRPATVSEVLLLASEQSLVSPPWVPWSERLSEYRRLRKDRREALALAIANGEVVDDSEDDDLEVVPDEESTHDLDWQSVDEHSLVADAGLDVPELEPVDPEVSQAEDTKHHSEDGSVKPPTKPRIRKRVIKNKTGN